MRKLQEMKQIIMSVKKVQGWFDVNVGYTSSHVTLQSGARAFQMFRSFRCIDVTSVFQALHN